MECTKKILLNSSTLCVTMSKFILLTPFYVRLYQLDGMTQTRHSFFFIFNHIYTQIHVYFQRQKPYTHTASIRMNDDIPSYVCMHRTRQHCHIRTLICVLCTLSMEYVHIMYILWWLGYTANKTDSTLTLQIDKPKRKVKIFRTNTNITKPNVCTVIGLLWNLIKFLLLGNTSRFNCRSMRLFLTAANLLHHFP